MKSNRIMHEMLYPHPLQRVWSALTNRGELAQWLLPNDFVPCVGYHFTFRSEAQDGWSGLVKCEVVEVEQYRRLAYLWLAHPSLPAMKITFTLEEVEGGAHLILEQTAGTTTGWMMACIRDALPSLHLSSGGLPPMTRFFRIMVDEIGLCEALFAFVANSNASSRNNQPVVEELQTFAPEMISVLEHMILDGVEERLYVEEYVHAVFGSISV